MSYYFPEGTRVYYSSTFAAAKTVTAVTNANPAVATSTAHGYVDNDIVLFDSGWEDADDALWKVDQVDANTFELEGLNSTSTTYFPAGSGAGSTQLVSSWVEVPQVLNINASGGDPKFASIEPLAKRNAISQFIGFNATNLTLTLGHDPSNATYLAMLDLSRTATKVGIKIVGGSGGVAYGYGFIGASEMPRYQRGQANSVDVAIALQGRLISYSS
jgi:hypothetical protein